MCMQSVVCLDQGRSAVIIPSITGKGWPRRRGVTWETSRWPPWLTRRYGDGNKKPSPLDPDLRVRG